uniref:Uncharacterized protein n=1 Tax=Aegilops tauschii subsp. strangulata TaxID=200361 RepID=A0A452Z2Q3_AEGTS
VSVPIQTGRKNGQQMGPRRPNWALLSFALVRSSPRVSGLDPLGSDPHFLPHEDSRCRPRRQRIAAGGARRTRWLRRPAGRWCRPWRRRSAVGGRPVGRLWLLPFGDANDSAVPPLCTRNHSVPAFLFSSGGFAGNLYHDYTDVLVPLFTSTHHFGGEVQFLLTDIKDWWLDKFTPLFRQLSNYDVIDVDNDQEVHCFSRIVISSTFHRPMGIDGTRSGGETVGDFKRLLCHAFRLDRVVAFHDGAASRGSSSSPAIADPNKKADT